MEPIFSDECPRCGCDDVITSVDGPKMCALGHVWQPEAVGVRVDGLTFSLAPRPEDFGSEVDQASLIVPPPPSTPARPLWLDAGEESPTRHGDTWGRWRYPPRSGRFHLYDAPGPPVCGDGPNAGPGIESKTPGGPWCAECYAVWMGRRGSEVER